MGQWISENDDRPDPALVRRCGEFPTSILGDCMNRFQTMSAGIQPLVAGKPLCGPALTVQAMESCNWGAHRALAFAEQGDVLVIAAGGGMSHAVWGHVMTHAARKRGLAGVVIDGCIRDGQENRADELPVFCRGVCPGGPHKGWPGNINVPISCAGVAVLPGDIIVGDDDGIAVVPRSRATEVLEEARERLHREGDWYKRIDNGELTASILGLIKPTDGSTGAGRSI